MLWRWGLHPGVSASAGHLRQENIYMLLLVTKDEDEIPTLSDYDIIFSINTLLISTQLLFH